MSIFGGKRERNRNSLRVAALLLFGAGALLPLWYLLAGASFLFILGGDALFALGAALLLDLLAGTAASVAHIPLPFTLLTLGVLLLWEVVRRYLRYTT